MSYIQDMTCPGDNPDVDAFNLLNAVLANNWLAAQAISEHGDPEEMLATIVAWLAIALESMSDTARAAFIARMRALVVAEH